MIEKNVSEIAKGVFKNQIHAIQINLDGCILGQDTIHLHDLRVANRRIRAALIEFKGLYPDDIVKEYRKEFQWIHQVTGPVRDLDVNLQHYPSYKSQIPKKWRPHLEPLKELILTKREIAQQQLIRDLSSDRISDILIKSTDDLVNNLPENTSLFLETAREYGCRRIIKRYQQVIDKGGKLSKKTPAKKFHNYRITVKNLRYLMEFFQPVLEDDRYDALRRGLKNVQDAFGAFQDADVQTAELRKFADELYSDNCSLDTLLSLGQLLFSLEKKGRQSKMSCLKQVSWVIDKATVRAFQTCFQYPVKR